MSPWWLRPTAEGAEEAKDQPAPQEKKKDDAKSGSTAKAGDDGGGRSRRSRSGGGGGSDRSRSRSRSDAKSDDKSDDKPAERSRSRSRSRSGGSDAKGDDKKAGDEKKSAAAKKGSSSSGRKSTSERKSGSGRKSASEGKSDGDKNDRNQRADKGRDDQKRNERSRGTSKDRNGRGRSGRSNGDGDGGGDERPREEYAFDDDVSQSDFAAIRREILSTPERNPVSDERKIALFCDLENVALGVRDSEVKKFDIDMVLERLLEKGKIIVKKAYCDWERYSEYKRGFHEAAIEMIDIPQKYYSGKNSADIKMVVDAMDLSFSKEHLDTFVILSGDSDFSPLVSKLKENNKYVIGIGVKGSSSNLLIDNCDEFIYYEDLWRDRQKAPKVAGTDSKKSEAFRLMVDAIQALLRDNKDVLWGSMIKQTMQRKKPSFSESYHGYSTFSELLEDAERSKLIKLKKDQRSGTYIVTGFAQR